MGFRTTRLTFAEWLLGVAALLLLVDLFGLTWFAYRSHLHAIMTALGQVTSANGWDTFTVLGPLTLIICLAGITVTVSTASRSSPAVPVVITTLLLPVSFIQMILVAIRVLLDPPSVHLVQAGAANVIDPRPGAYLGLALSVAVFAGSYLSLRRDGVTAEDAPKTVELIPVPTESSGAPASRG